MVESSEEPGPDHPSGPSVRLAHASRGLPGLGSKNRQSSKEIPAFFIDQDVSPSRGDASNGSPINTRDPITEASHKISEKDVNTSTPSAPPSPENVQGEESSTMTQADKSNILHRCYGVCKGIVLASWINVLLVFVPIGIAVEVAGVSPTIVFAMNAIAIIPLAGLLSYATESVASEMGDTIGALMNVTFGNAVELIIL
ncbi:MAG: hypothetical protein Q9222_003541 [Ikaeria aurantiellina]